ncbi:glyoxalase [Mesorhizobium sp. M1C.F.Ca.ET.193.01.1.1]|uniref:VOC family protein n=1 Tax=unclassified Mesorhizobium TaxID=325217 RepID=UPI000FD1EDE9|nr:MULTISPECIES: VOC family protein [unclassified Mesorhizobium]TGT01465.1 glyoxalase [bacterium M00.F.Ca.ET.177.01.1.1]TGQ54225.1 glyoxalase [Mesorhizobium sp. M1C.F.Ca.ET.210.01.1.1]TGQ72238.1 glyoxalase [Mesorhizobium sp. M1C.F.Ca.ET.212.01.1.1]TGR10054.1 glyoxalase [Mesorhizobium sp. M1C.F.Ca.ET.204.01.1.1]TGR30174.1 glyoxalase [Mesorhizobium sp. M1C.F.Ca.ET.196.01.1.1]
MPTATEAPCIYPALRYANTARMIDWLCDAFGFEVRARYGEGDIVHHAELTFGSSMIMLGTARDDDYGKMVGEPGGGGGKSIYIAVGNADVAYARAKKAGAKIVQELVDRDYGSREFICLDPEGNVWSFGTYWPKAGEKGRGIIADA